MTQINPTILVVEDSPDVRAVLVRLLQHNNYEVIETTNGFEALAQIQQHRPDLVLLDLSMPIMDGWTTLESIRALPGCATLPIVAVTAHTMGGDREAVLRHGFNAYVMKPLDIRIFLATIADTLRRTTNRS